MNAPTTAPAPTAIPDKLNDATPEQYLAMVEKCIPIQKSEYLSLLYMRAEMRHDGDVQTKKAQFMKAAGRLDPSLALPPMTDAALRIIAAPKLVKKGH